MIDPVLQRERRTKYELLLAEANRRLQRRRYKGAGGLYRFVQDFWYVLEPETPMVDGWPMEAICDHLEAVTHGEINRLLINVPPGFCKSLLVDVFWPAWEWAIGKHHLRYLTFSYSATLTERDNTRFFDLVSCGQYQQLFPHVRLVKVGERKVSNTGKGWKLASSVGGVGTGERGDRVILDDPHNVKESESDTVRTETVRWFREAMSNRLNDLQRGAIIIIMQRVHEEDVSGAILSLGLDYCHLMIPMEYDTGRQMPNDLGWVDPRAANDNDGELAWEARFPPQVVAQTKREVGPYAWAGQYQQMPAPRGGGIIQRDWWQLYESDDGKFPVFDLILASLDSAFTEKEQNDPSGLTLWGLFTDPVSKRKRVMLVHAWRKHLAFSGPREERLPNETHQRWVLRTQKNWGLIEWLKHTCERFKVEKLLIEAKASGISAAQELRARYKNLDFTVQLCQVSGDKVARALAVQPSFSQQMVYAPVRDWAEMVIDEMAVFPKGKYKDLTDSATQALKYLRDNGLLESDEEAVYAEHEAVRHRPRKKAVYPV